MAFGVTVTPAPISLSARACSKTRTGTPKRCREKAAVRPPIPAPMIATGPSR
jgi:hypothetical protein